MIIKAACRGHTSFSFLHLHHQIGARNSKDTGTITGVKEHTLLGCLPQSSIIKEWVDIVDSLTAGSVLSALPENLRELFIIVYPVSTVCAKKYRNKIRDNNNKD
jgi:hypothetical protein